MKVSEIKKLNLMAKTKRFDWGPQVIEVENYYDQSSNTGYQIFKDPSGKIKYALVTSPNRQEILAFPADPKEYKEVDPE